jgi:hypothetical protein
LNSALNISTDDGDWSLYEGAAAATSNLTIGSTGFLTIDSNSSGDSALAISGALVNDTTIQLIPKGYPNLRSLEADFAIFSQAV